MPDFRDWPQVYKTVFLRDNAHSNIDTVPRKRFYEVAGMLSGLIVPRERISYR